MPRVAIRWKPSSARSRAIGSRFALSSLLTLTNAVPRSGSRCPTDSCAFANATPKLRRPAHHLAGRLHLGPENRVDAREPHEREHRALHEHAGDLDVLGQPELGERPAGHHLGGDLRQRHAGGLRQVRHRARRARIHFEHVHDVVLDRVLHVHQADHLQRARDAARVVANRREVALGADERRHDARAVAGVNAGLLDVLHDAADDDGAGRVGDRVDVELERVLEELVDQHRMLRRRVDRVGHVAVERVRRRRRSPCRGRRARRTAAPPPESRSTPRRRAPPAREVAVPLAGCVIVEALEQRREALAILGEVDRIGRRAENPDAGVLQRERQLERRLAAELHEARHVAAGGPLGLDHRHHVLERERLEVQPVGGVVVGRHRLRVAVDHDRLEPFFPQREGRVTAAVVELDALADAVRPAAEDDDLVARVRVRLAASARTSCTDTA